MKRNYDIISKKIILISCSRHEKLWNLMVIPVIQVLNIVAWTMKIIKHWRPLQQNTWSNLQCLSNCLSLLEKPQHFCVDSNEATPCSWQPNFVAFLTVCITLYVWPILFLISLPTLDLCIRKRTGEVHTKNIQSLWSKLLFRQSPNKFWWHHTINRVQQHSDMLTN